MKLFSLESFPALATAFNTTDLLPPPKNCLFIFPVTARNDGFEVVHLTVTGTPFDAVIVLGRCILPLLFTSFCETESLFITSSTAATFLGSDFPWEEAAFPSCT